MKAAEAGWGPLKPHPPGLPGDAWHPEIGIFGALEAGGSHFLRNRRATPSTGSLLPFSMPVTCPSFSQSASQSTNTYRIPTAHQELRTRGTSFPSFCSLENLVRKPGLKNSSRDTYIPMGLRGVEQ